MMALEDYPGSPQGHRVAGAKGARLGEVRAMVRVTSMSW